MDYDFCTSGPEGQWIPGAIATGGSAEARVRFTGASGQTWKGFGGCFNELGWEALGWVSEEAREAVLAGLFAADGCGFNYCRLPIGASDYALTWYSHNEVDGDFAMEHFSIERDRRYLLPYLAAARRHATGLTLFASPWSPPTWMKFPRSYNYGRLVFEPEYLRAYARYFVRFIEAYAAEGVAIDAVHVQNEPNSDQKFPSCVWTGGQMRDFIRDYLGPAFAEAGLSTEIWAGTIERPQFNDWAQTILIDPGARALVRGVGYQWAGREAVQRTHLAWPELPIVQTENECGNGDNSWQHAHHVFDLVHHYLLNGVEAYVYWNMVLPAGGESSWGWHQNSMVSVDRESRSVTWNPEFFVLKHFAHAVRPGAVVCRLAGNWAANAVGFRNPAGDHVVVLQNPFDRPLEVALTPPSGDPCVCTLPAGAIGTLRWRE